MKKTAIIVGIVIVLAGSGYFLLSRPSAKKYTFRFDQVSLGDLDVNVTATGTIDAVTTVEVGTQVSGIISKLYADFNSMVKAGQIIAQIDPTFLQQSVKDAEANLQRAQAQFEDAHRNLSRAQQLFDKQLESQENLDAAQTAFESNQAALKQAQATLDRAKINLSYATIYAPIDGVIIDRKVNVGQTVAASFSSPTLYTIANDLSKMQVETTVDESDIGKVSIGQSATFSVDAYPDEKFSGFVSQIRLAPVSISNVVNYTVIVEVKNDQLKLMPGMTANVKILVASDKSVLRVSNMALRFQPSGDLIDSTMIKAQRPDRSQGGQGGNGAPPQNAETVTKPDTIKEQSAFSLEKSGNPQHDLRSRKPREASAEPILANKMSHQNPNFTLSEGAPFGITQKYPVYQKSPYVPSNEFGFGKVWILNEKGKLIPVRVRTGLSDGKYTQITSDELKDGDKIVVGASSDSEIASQARSPLTGAGGPPGGGGRPGGGMH
jgi:HlyD family secretion protein